MGFSLRQKRDTWSQLKDMSPERRVASRDVYNNQQIERSEIGEKQTMTTRLIAVWAIAIGTFILCWCIMSVCQFFLGITNGDAEIPITTSGGAPPGGSSSVVEPYVPVDSGLSGNSGVSSNQVTLPDGSVAQVPDNPDEDWGTIFDDELALEGDDVSVQADASVDQAPSGPPNGAPGVDATGASAPSVEGYAAARKLTFEQFQTRYFFKSSAGLLSTWINRVTGKEYFDSDVYDIYKAIAGGDQTAYVMLYGDMAYMGMPGSTGASGTQAPDSSSGQATDPSGSGSQVGPDVGQNPGGVVTPDVSNPGGVYPGDGSGSLVVEPDVPTRMLTYGDYVKMFTFGKFALSLFAAAMAWLIAYEILKRNLDTQNALVDTVDINQYPNDQHIALPEETQRDFDWFPDVGAHSPVQVSSMISHMALENKGLKTVSVVRRADKDILDKDGNVVYLKGEVLVDGQGLPIVDTKPMIDEKFSDALFEASGVMGGKRPGPGFLKFLKLPTGEYNFRKRYDTTQIPYNPGNQNRNKLKGAETVADMINKYWTFPQYEPQRPSGAYIVDTDPVNTIKSA